MSPHVPEKTGTRHTDTQWKVEGEGREGKNRSTQNTPCSRHANKLYKPKHEESDACANISKPLTKIGRSRSYLLTQLNAI